MRVLLVLLCACKQVYGLAETNQADAAYYDAPPRGPSQCPPIGGELAFAPQLHQLRLDCTQYTRATDAPLAVAMCREQIFQIYQGPPEGPLAPVPELPRSTANVDVSNPVISPEGTRLFLSTFDLTTVTGALLAYHRAGTTWVRDPNIANAPPLHSTVSRGPDARMLGTSGPSDVIELSDATGTWKVLRTHTLAALKVPSVGSIWLSPDGLRMLFVADAFNSEDYRYIAYADRPTKADTFSEARRVLSIAAVNDLFVTEDCDRVYFSGLHSIFYEEQAL